MTNFVGRGLDIIGVRAVIQDVRQYQIDGRTLVKVDEQIAFANEKVAQASVKQARVQTVSDLQRQRSLNNLTKAYKDHVRDVSEATRKLNEGIAKANSLVLTPAAPTQRIPKGQKGAGQFAPAGSKFQGSTLLLGGSAALTKAERDFKNAESATVRLQSALNNIRADGIHRVRQAVISVRQTIESTADANINASNRLKRADLERLQLLKRIRDAEAERRRIAIQLAGAATVAVGVGITASSLTEASKYEDVLAKIDAQTNVTTADVNKLGDAFLKASKSLPVSATDQAEAAFVTLSSGVKDLRLAQDIVTLSSKAQVAQMGKAADFAKSLTAVVNAYGEENIDAATTANIIAQAIKSGSVNAEDYIGQIGRLVGVAPNLNVKFSELAATTADLTNRGLTASEAFTAVLGVLNELGQQSPGQIEALAGVGLDFAQVLDSIKRIGFVETLISMDKAFRDQGKSIQDVFPNIRAYNGFLNLVSKNGKSVKDIQLEIANSGNALQESFDVSKGRISAVVQILKNQFNAALIEIGRKLIPEATLALADLSEWLDKNQESINEFIVDGIKAAVSILKDFITGISETVKFISDLNQGFKDVTGVAPGAATAVAAIGAALAWALPGSPYMKGLLLAITLIGRLKGLEAGDPVDTLKKQRDETQKQIEQLEKAPPQSGGVKGVLEDITRLVASSSGDVFVQGKTKEQEEQLAIARERLVKINEDLRNKEIEAAGGLEAYNAQFLDMADKTKKAAISEKDLNNATNAHTLENEKAKKAAEEAAEAAKKLAQEFKSASEAAGQVESLTSSLKLFGEISQELASSRGLTATQAGNIQGIDAVARAQERASRSAYQFTAALATVAQAFQSSAAVANRIVRDMAQSALEASQSALNDVLSRPTREIANANVGLAQQRQVTANLTLRDTPRINALNDQMKAIDRKIRDANKQRAAAQKTAEAANKARDKARDQAARQRDAMLDAMKLANLQAAIAAERQLAATQKLIDANTKQQADLQEAFRAESEARQQQINEAIGRGDTDTALRLTQEQIKAGKAYQAQQKALQKGSEELTTTLKKQKEAEEERQRQVRLQEAQAEAQAKAIEAQDTHTESVEANTDAIDSQIEALEAQKEAIADQVEAIQGPIDASKRQEEAIQNQIAVYQGQADQLKAWGDAVDQTLLTQQQQKEAAIKLIEQIRIESGAVKKYSDLLGESTIPSVNKANEQFELLQGMLKTVTNEAFRKTLIDKGIDPAAIRLDIFRQAVEDATESVKKNTAANKPKTDAEKKAEAEKAAQTHAGQNEVIQHIELNVDVGNIFESIESAKKLRQELQGAGVDAFKLKDKSAEVNSQLLAASIAAAGLGQNTSSIRPPNVGDAGLQTLSDSILAAQNYGVTLSTQIVPPDIGDAGRQVIDESINSAYQLSSELRNIQEPDVGDAGRGEILGALSAARSLAEALKGIGKTISNIGKGITDAGKRILPQYELGGFTPAAGKAFPAILHPNELVLPLDDKNRVDQLLASIGKATASGRAGAGGGGGGTLAPAAPKSIFEGFGGVAPTVPTFDFTRGIVEKIGALGRSGAGGGSGGIRAPVAPKTNSIVSMTPNAFATMLSNTQTSNVFAPNISVTGATLESMEAMAVGAVQRSFRDARTTSVRSGSLLSQNIGPNR